MIVTYTCHEGCGFECSTLDKLIDHYRTEGEAVPVTRKDQITELAEESETDKDVAVLLWSAMGYVNQHFPKTPLWSVSWCELVWNRYQSLKEAENEEERQRQYYRDVTVERRSARRT